MTVIADNVTSLSQPDSFDEPTASVEVIETHISWVFLTDRYAYKLKKPIRYDYLDFTTLAARERNARDEVRLNRRLAPDVYLGVVPLNTAPSGKVCVRGSGDITDWLVKMRRLPGDRMLDVLIRNGRLQLADLDGFADRLFHFYSHEHSIPWSGAEYLQRLRQDVARNENFFCRRAPEGDLPPDAFDACAWQCEYLDSAGELLGQRAEAGRLIEAHGDLRPEHICLETPPVVIDCLEFDRQLRILDPVHEIAYLALECERLGNDRVGNHLLDRYRKSTGDEFDASLVDFYKSYRGCLRARLALAHLEDGVINHAEKWRRQARDYSALAIRHGANRAVGPNQSRCDR
ncbi:MAG: hypothetical protein VX663_07570 [Pseudomonadota bacterium]|nr:hypothetical protein [Pseudomonadota bacterium]